MQIFHTLSLTRNFGATFAGTRISINGDNGGTR